MVESLSIALLASVGLLTFFAVLVRSEEKAQKRKFLGTLRYGVDAMLDTVVGFLGQRIRYVERYIIRMSWYYSVHKILRFILAGLVRIYDALEQLFIKNRERAKVIKKEKKQLGSLTHLEEIAKHKSDSELSPQAKKKLLKEKLERG